MSTYLHLPLLLLPLADFCAAVGGWWLARFVRPVTDLIPGVQSYFDPEFIPSDAFMWKLSLWSAGLFVMMQLILGRYRSVSMNDHVTPLPQLVSVIVWGALVVSYFAMVEHQVIFSRMMMVQAIGFTLLGVMFFRALLWSVQGWMLRLLPILRTGVIIIGNEHDRDEWRERFAQLSQYRLVNEYEIDHIPPSSSEGAQEVWCVTPEMSPEQEELMRLWCYERALIWRGVPTRSALFAHIETIIVDGIPLVSPQAAALSGWSRIGKRLIDISTSLVLLVLLSPVLALMGLLVWLGDRRPLLYASERVGRGGVSFSLLKFRSMVTDAESKREELAAMSHRDGPFFKVKNDPRVTPVGRWLRRWSLDELPQLWNVLRGDMSLIGPRPHLPSEVAEITPQFRRVLSIRPGITGLAQVSGRSDLPFAEEMRLDTTYLEQWSMGMDIRILLKTPFVLLQGQGAD